MEYIEMLTQEFLDRKKRRPSYSERAFARDLRVSPGYISLLFRGKRTLSLPKGVAITQRLGWSEEKADQFLGLLQKCSLQSSRQAATRAAGSSATKFISLSPDTFRFIADLNHTAALTLIQSRPAVEAREVATELSISPKAAELVVDRLVRLDLVKRQGGQLRATKISIEIKEVPSEAIRAFHRHAILKAEEAIEGQTVEQRNLAALTLAVDQARIPEAKAYVNRFLKSFEKKFGNAAKGTVYQMNTQFFALSGKGKL